MSTTEIKIPGPDHPITIEPEPGRVLVRAGERVIADSDRALVLHEAGHPPVHYVPLADLDRSLTTPSATTSWCPYKGRASYLTVRAGEELLTDVVWYYPDALEAVAPIGDHAAFYADRVTVEVQPPR